MRRFRLLAAVSIALALPAGAGAQTTLIGSTFGLEGHFQETRGARPAVVRVPASATVRDPGVEFPQVSRLFDTPEARRLIREGRLHRFVNTWIDIGPNWIEIDFRRAGTGQFTAAAQNTYVFVFEKDTPVRLENARIHPRTTLPLGGGRLWSQGNRLYLNVQGLGYRASSFVRIVFDVAPAIGGAPGQAPPEVAARAPAAPSEAPVPVPAPPGIYTTSP